MNRLLVVFLRRAAIFCCIAVFQWFTFADRVVGAEATSPIVDSTVTLVPDTGERLVVLAKTDMGKGGPKLLYCYYLPFQEGTNPGDWQHVIAVRNSDGSLTLNTIRVRAPFWVFSPRFSPDGSKVLFLIGDPFVSEAPVAFFAWDLRSNKVISGPKENIQNREVFWSRDSKSVVYFRIGHSLERQGLNIHLFDFETQNDRKIGDDFAIPYVDWFGPQKLLVSGRGLVSQKLRLLDLNDGTDSATGFSGATPLLSPNGTWLVVVQSKPTGQGSAFRVDIVLNDVKGGTSFVVPIPNSADLQYSWSSDGRTLLFLRKIGAGRAALTKFDPVSRKMDHVAIIEGHNRAKAPLSPYIKLVPGALLDREVYVTVRESGERLPNSPLRRGFTVLKSVDLQSKKVTSLLEVVDATGVDVLLGP